MSPPPEVAAAGGSHFAQAVALLARRPGRAARLATALTVAAAGWEIGRKAFTKARAEIVYSVSLPDDDDAYDDVHGWLVANISPRRRRALIARSSRRPRSSSEPTVAYEANGKRPEPDPLIRLFYDGSQAQTVTIDGHRVRVEVERENLTGNAFRIVGESSGDSWRLRERIIFRAHGQAARDGVLAFLERMAEAKRERTTNRFYIALRWGDWNRRAELQSRPLESIILREGQREAIATDLAAFLEAEHLYGRVGLPWHRGYVFHGPPGTGKTSLAKALAEHFELDVHYVPLSDLTADTNLFQLLSSIEPRSMLVLEDVDVVHAARSRDDAETKNSVSASGLLNALDGLATPHGLITVMTTNDLGALDKALLRAGRADLVEELGYLDDDQLARLGALVAGRPVELPSLESLRSAVGPVQLTHAALVEVAKPHLDDPVRAEQAMRYVVTKALRARQTKEEIHA